MLQIDPHLIICLQTTLSEETCWPPRSYYNITHSEAKEKYFALLKELVWHIFDNIDKVNIGEEDKLWVRFFVACCGSDQQCEKLINDPSIHVRLALAKHRNNDFRRKLLDDPDPRVRQTVQNEAVFGINGSKEFLKEFIIDRRKKS